MDILVYIIVLVVGFITGTLVTRNNIATVNKVVEEAKELAEKAEAELEELKAELKAKQSKPATKRGRKPAAKE